MPPTAAIQQSQPPDGAYILEKWNPARHHARLDGVLHHLLLGHQAGCAELPDVPEPEPYLDLILCPAIQLNAEWNHLLMA